MKQKIILITLCMALVMTFWSGIAPRPAMAATVDSPMLSWLGNNNLMNSLLSFLSPTNSTGSSDNTGSSTNTGNSDGTTSGNAGSGSTSGSTTNSGSGTTSSDGTTALTTAEKNYQKYMPHYLEHEKPIVDSYRKNFDGSLAQTIVGRAIWYMEYGYIVYGHHKYWDTGYIDCSNFVSLVYKDFGYTVTTTARKYTTVGTKVEGVYAQKQSNGKYALVGVDKLKPGDIFTFWNTDANGKYISHVAMYMGVVNGKPSIINTCKEHPTAIGIINGFSYWYGEQLFEVRRVLPASAFTANNTSIKDLGPVIPAQYQLKPQAKIVMPKDLATGF